MTPSVPPAQQSRLSRAPSRPACRRRRPGRRRLFLAAPGFLPQATGLPVQHLAYAQSVAASGRLCRHRREGEARGDFGARQGAHAAPKHEASRAMHAVPAGLADGPVLPPLRHARRRHAPDERSARPAQRASSPARARASSSRADGYAVTNNHVVDKAETVEVTTDDGKTYTAKVIGTDPRTDLALIKVEGRNDFPFVQLRRRGPAHRRLGAGGRQSVRPRRHRDGRHRLGARPRHRRRPL